MTFTPLDMGFAARVRRPGLHPSVPLANTVTKFAQRGPPRGISVTKLALLAQKHRFWRVLHVLGEFSRLGDAYTKQGWRGLGFSDRLF